MASETKFGTLVRDHLGAWPYPYFLPNSLPKTVSVSEPTWEKLLFAQGALGELAALTRVLRPSELGLKFALFQEALSSSRIEGTQASLVEVLQADLVKETVSQDAEEVLNYFQAMDFAVSAISEFPLARRVICAAHEILMQGERGRSKTPGEFRRTPVWVGSYNSTPESAKFIPPLPSHLTELFAEWEVFVNSNLEMPLIIKLALAHYQFETIHPFLDGNGRIGRIIIELMLVRAGVLGGPYLGISRFIEQNRDEYYDVLENVRVVGDIEGLVRYFAQGIETEALRTSKKLEALISLREQWIKKFSTQSKSMPGLIYLLLEHPILTVSEAQSRLGVSQPTASTLLRSAQKLGLITSRGQVGRGRRETWISEPVWQILSPFEAA